MKSSSAMSKPLSDEAATSAKVKKATQNAQHGAEPHLLKEICDASYSDETAEKILAQCRDGLLNPGAKNYYQMYNSLVLAEYLLLNGREELADKFDSHLRPLFKLKTYQCGEMPDLSQLIREKATKIINLLNNGELLYEERLQLFQERNKSRFLLSHNGVSAKPASKLVDEQVCRLVLKTYIIHQLRAKCGLIFIRKSDFFAENCGNADFFY